MSFKKIGLAALLVASAPLSVEACGIGSPEVIANTEQDLSLLPTPYSDSDEAIITVHEGASVYATCYDQSVAIGVDHVRVNFYRSGGYFLNGYVQVQDRPQGADGPIVNTLNFSARQLRESLPDC